MIVKAAIIAGKVAIGTAKVAAGVAGAALLSHSGVLDAVHPFAWWENNNIGQIDLHRVHESLKQFKDDCGAISGR